MEETGGVKQMKKNNVRMIIVLVFSYLFCIGIGKALTKIDSTVLQNGYVQKVEDNIVTIVDVNGNKWEWEQEGKENFHKMDSVKIIFNNQNTKDVKDDVILKIKVDN